VESQAVIRIEDIWKSFGSHQVLRGVNLSVRNAETLVVLGPSGCGKSVLLKHIIGLMRPDRGSIFVEGSDVTRISRPELNKLRMKFGMVFQGAALFDSMTVGQNVGLPLREHKFIKGAELDRLVDEKLEMVGLSGTQHLWPAEISGGMKKRVALARAIALDPDVILYDEPTTGLDPVMAEQINWLIRDTQAKLGATSIVVTHDLHSACFTGDRVALMDEGKIAFEGTTDELRTTNNEAVQNFIARGHKPLPGESRSRSALDPDEAF
jgi:phospholipid/cholesterol/gamma-HCH transport system ATP-binding protein